MKEEVEARENILVGRRGKHMRFVHLFKFNKLFSSAYYASGTLLRTFHILKDLILVTIHGVATSTIPVL